MPDSVPPGLSARFDDLTRGRGFRLEDAVEVYSTGEVGRVVDVLRAAEDAARRGAWVAGFITYEAAPGLARELPVCRWESGHPLADLPLIWFAAFRGRRDIPPPPGPGGPSDGTWCLDRDEIWHRAAVAHTRDTIARGAVYQLNLTARAIGWTCDANALYARMCHAQAGEFCALLGTGHHQIVSASPELFFELDGDRVISRPMKGTAPRRPRPDEDRRAADRLRASPKERAENIMITDLIRNDLGRIARPGGVTVRSLLRTEAYPNLWQLTSTVQAHLLPGAGLVETLRALFPSGSITGAPKLSAMRAIADIEDRPRGVYCGAVGYLAPGWSAPYARFSVAIRTATTVAATGYTEYGSGGGITWSSDPQREWQELTAKAAVPAGARWSEC